MDDGHKKKDVLWLLSSSFLPSHGCEFKFNTFQVRKTKWVNGESLPQRHCRYKTSKDFVSSLHCCMYVSSVISSVYKH